MTAAKALALIGSTKFRPFDESDYMGFAGVESDTPMIGENGEYTILLDNDVVLIVDGDWNDSITFQLSIQ